MPEQKTGIVHALNMHGKTTRPFGMPLSRPAIIFLAVFSQATFFSKQMSARLRIIDRNTAHETAAASRMISAGHVTIPDSELIQQARTGHAAAFRELVDRYKATMHRIAYHVSGNAEDAYDVTQNVFVRLYSLLTGFDTSKPFAAWLYRMTMNASIDMYRKKKRSEDSIETLDIEPMDTAESSQPDAEVESTEFYRIIRHATNGLTERQREVFVLRDMESFTIEEIAVILGCSESTVRVHLAAARERMRNILMKQHPELMKLYGMRESSS